MADSLDDFFAKKDKSKKTKKKNITTEDMAKKLEETAKRTDKSRKIKEKTNNTNPLITNIDVQVCSHFHMTVHSFIVWTHRKTKNGMTSRKSEKKTTQGLEYKPLPLSESTNQVFE